MEIYGQKANEIDTYLWELSDILSNLTSVLVTSGPTSFEKTLLRENYRLDETMKSTFPL